MTDKFATGFVANKKPNKHKLFCRLPFTEISISPNGDITPTCCPDWVDIKLGNILEKSWQDIWNGPESKSLRRSTFDGSLSHCSSEWCPAIQSADNGFDSANVFRHEDINSAYARDPELKKIFEAKQESVAFAPKTVNLIYDRSCNLRCPSCRDEILKLNDEETKMLNQIHEVVTKDVVKYAETLTMGGTGDPIASPVLRQFLISIEKQNFPNLKVLGLQTNAQLLTPKLWDKMKGVQEIEHFSLEVSIDAATSPTYDIVRPPGKWEPLMDNLRFIKEIDNLGMLIISFVVQETNYHEMLQFIKLGEYLSSFGKKTPVKVMFYQIRSWGQFTKEGYQTKQVQNVEHPLHENFLKVLKGVEEKRIENFRNNRLPMIEHNFPYNDLIKS